MIEIFFFISLFMIFYAYFGYPISLIFIGILFPKKITRASHICKCTLIIAVYNEEKRIEDKIINSLSQDYPKDNLQIIISSDGSTDNTNEIIKKYENCVELLDIKERRGKEYAQNEAIKMANGDVLVFSDVATKLPINGLRQIISNFHDKSVGAVSGEDKIVGNEGGGNGEGLYIRYEMWLRRLESNVNSLVGLSGSFFAARKEVCGDFSISMQSDFRTVLNCIRKKYRAISDPESIGYYSNVSNINSEFERKIRTVLRGLTVFFENIELLNIFKHGIFSYQLFCHKLLRWMVPLFLFFFLIFNAILVKSSILYLIVFVLQLTFYIIGVACYKRRSDVLRSYEKIPMYLCVVNMAIAKAWWRYIKGERIVLWNPSQR